MITIEKLNQFGANTAEGISRCAGSEALYLRLVGMIPKEQSFDKLKTAIEENNYDDAFAAAHTLKGVLGNLSLTPMFETADRMTELLRARTQMDYTDMLNDLLGMRDTLTALCSE